MGLTAQKSLFYLFFFVSILFILSWFFVLRSAGRHYSLDFTILPNTNIFSTTDHDRLQGSDPSFVNLKNRDGPNDRNFAECSSTKKELLKVFMYDLPPEFHFGLLGWKPDDAHSVWPDIKSHVPPYPGGLNLQHSIEYWLALDILYSEISTESSGRNAVRVRNSSEADVIFVPFFSSICYNRFSKVKGKGKKSINALLQEKLVQFLMSQTEWKRSGGVDHIVLAHHPNSLLQARMQLWPAVFILSDFGRYPPTVANVEKDVIAPYKHVIPSYVNDSSNFDGRSTLLYFQGAVYRKDGGVIRQELFYMLKDEKDVHFSFGSVQKDGIHQATRGMHSSKYCLNIAGDTPSSNRLFDAIASHCVPVIISDEIELPYEDVLDYTEFSVFVRTADALKKDFLLTLLRSIGKDEWTRMWKRLKEIERFYEFLYPSKDDDAVQMIWQAIARKVPAIKLKMHKTERYSRSRPPRERGLMSFPVPKNIW